jgi:hypothetical protein
MLQVVIVQMEAWAAANSQKPARGRSPIVARSVEARPGTSCRAGETGNREVSSGNSDYGDIRPRCSSTRPLFDGMKLCSCINSGRRPSWSGAATAARQDATRSRRRSRTVTSNRCAPPTLPARGSTFSASERPRVEGRLNGSRLSRAIDGPAKLLAQSQLKSRGNAPRRRIECGFL